MSQAGNHAAVIQLLDESVRALVLYARQWDANHAEDVVQEAFLRLLTETPFPESPRAWLFRVVRNRSIDLARREQKMSRREIVGSWFEPSTNGTGPSHDPAHNPGRDLTEALDRLPPDVREIIISKVWGNLNFREIAELTGRSTSSVHHDYWRGIRQLRTFFGED